MEASDRKIGYFQIHLAVFLFGFTAILGDLISLSALPLVWWRVVMASLFLGLFLAIKQKLTFFKQDKNIKGIALTGALLGVHWILFYASIKHANPSVALICFSLTSFFTALLSPFFDTGSVSKLEVLWGLLVLPCMLFIVKDIDITFYLGFVYGLLAAFMASLVTIYNKKVSEELDSYSNVFVQMVSASLVLSICILALSTYESFQFAPSPTDFGYLLILVLVCTIFAYSLEIKSLKVISAFEANMIFNLEPVYGILMAYFLLDDKHELEPSFYFGGAFILMLVMTFPLLNRRKKVPQPI